MATGQVSQRHVPVGRSEIGADDDAGLRVEREPGLPYAAGLIPRVALAQASSGLPWCTNRMRSATESTIRLGR